MTDILVLSNNFSNRIAYTAALNGYGYEVREAQTVNEAQSLLRAGLMPRAIVVDMKFSNALGEAYDEFNRIYRNATRPVLIIIGGVENAHLTDGVADVLLPRPVELEDLIAHVEQYLN
jgi:CheY-like chemotaxis protein